MIEGKITEEYKKIYIEYEKKFGEPFPAMEYQISIKEAIKMMKRAIWWNKPLENIEYTDDEDS